MRRADNEDDDRPTRHSCGNTNVVQHHEESYAFTCDVLGVNRRTRRQSAVDLVYRGTWLGTPFAQDPSPRQLLQPPWHRRLGVSLAHDCAILRCTNLPIRAADL